MLIVELESPRIYIRRMKRCMEKGLIVLLFFWQLYRNEFMRISPPLTISKEEIKKVKKLF